MKIYKVRLTGHLAWSINANDPISWETLPSLKGIVFNPFAFLNDGEQTPFSVKLADGSYRLVTSHISFAFESNIDLVALSQVVEVWLRMLRVATKQSSLPLNIVSIAVGDIEDSKLHVVLPPEYEPGSVMMFGPHRVENMVNGAVISTVNKWHSLDEIPIFHELLLDAMHAHKSKRFRDSILYSAFAVESLAQHELTRNYEMAINAINPPEHLNILSFNLPNCGTQKKDPIYTFLVETDNFKRLLHEAPLYLMRRSLQDEFPDLFRQATQLYGSRNKLSHGQEIPSSDTNLLKVDNAGAKTAVRIAIDVFNWFGVNGYIYPDTDRIDSR